jgi:hypothetical protein
MKEDFAAPPWEVTPNNPNPPVDQTHINVFNLEGLWIPKEYLYAVDLSEREIKLMSYIKMLDKEHHCWASNETLGKLIGINAQSIKNIMVGLKRKGYLDQVSWDGRTRRVIRCLK